jgi:multiple sugar transport system ATP-binding protein
VARIRFQSVSKRYGHGAAAVSNLNLDIQDQEFLVLLGPSGCGKSTTLNMIAGLEDITHGVLWFDDQIVNNVPAHKRDVAMVFQSYALYPHKSVFENIAFGLRMRHVPALELERRVRDAAERLEITHLLGRRPSQLSGGQRQRVALGRAMVREPSVFLMDEPLSNLDASLRVSMRAQIRHLHAQMRSTFVYVTHDQAEALTLADRIVVMRDGTVQQIGTPGDIYDRPANVFVAAFLGSPAINLLDGVLSTEGGAPCFRRGELIVPLPDSVTAGWPGDRREVVLGLRAEDVGAPGPAGPILRGVVDTAMPVGSDQFLGLLVEDSVIFVRVDKDARVKEGEPVAFGLNPARVHVFDKASGRSLLAGGVA